MLVSVPKGSEAQVFTSGKISMIKVIVTEHTINAILVEEHHGHRNDLTMDATVDYTGDKPDVRTGYGAKVEYMEPCSCGNRWCEGANDVCYFE